MALRTNKMPVLQEKSASGAVASFNTALAMPLASCNIAVNAWQEGSGDPSPSNVRAIHGFSVVNATANNIVHTIQLGQEVYGAEADLVNGVAHVTHELITFDGSSDENWVYHNNQAFYIENGFANAPTNFITNYNNPVCLCNLFREAIAIAASSFLPQWRDVSFFNQQGYYKRLWVKDTSITSLDDFKAMLSNTPLQIVYPLAAPFDIQLTSAQIETLIGNNTIFADTGYIDLTYKDLDIAKRGNFREVFKLPS